MSKFLEAVENNIPEKDLDKITDAKRALQRFLLSKDINVKVKTFRDDVMIELEDGRIVKLEVRDITDNVEDQEVVSGSQTYDVDAEVANLAAKAKSGAAGLAGKVFRTGAQKAKSALKAREKVAKKAIDVYVKDTKNLEKTISNKARA